MPLFKRRNAVKAKQGRNAHKESIVNEDETVVIGEINSLLNELVTAVSEQTDTVLKNDGHDNTFSTKDVSKHTNPAKENGECSKSALTFISQQNDTSQENDMCSSSVLGDNVSEKKDSAEERNARGTITQANDSIPKQIDSPKKYDSFMDTAQSNVASKQTNLHQENDRCLVTASDISNQIGHTQTNDEDTSAFTADDVSKEIDHVQESNEGTSSANDVSEKSKQVQKSDEDTSSENDVPKKIDLVLESDEGTSFTNDVAKKNEHVQENDEGTNSLFMNDVSNEAKREMDESYVTKNVSSEIDLEENISTHETKIAVKKTRSSSESGSGIESHAKYVRRKFGSEAEILSICKKILPPEHQKEINEAVAKYIDNLIKESVSKAVQSIDVDNLCQELIKDVTNRKNSQSTESEEDFVVEQRLSSNSISELVELENVGNKTNEDQNDSLLSERDDRISETESLENEADDVDRASFGGYLADLEDTASVDDFKSVGGDSLNNSSCSGFEDKHKSHSINSRGSETGQESTLKTADGEFSDTITVNVQTVDNKLNEQENCQPEEITHEGDLTAASLENVGESENPHLSDEKKDHSFQINPEKNLADKQEQNEELLLPSENNQNVFMTYKTMSTENSELSLKSLDEEHLLMKNDFKMQENKSNSQMKSNSLPNKDPSEEERLKVNWRVGNLQVKLPHKSRGKTSLKAWKKRRVVIQPDEFVNDPSNQSLVISVYGSKKHETSFWHSVSSQKAVVFRSSSHTHRYAFTISEEGQAIIHLSAENETETQEWMAAIRAVLWPPSPFMELEKMLSGQEFEVSIIDNEFSYHAGLLGMYGYMSITPKKLILLHPQQGYVIQEWYLNTVDKFQFVLQPKADDMHKVLCMTTCKDSSTGQGDIIFYCKEAVTLLQALASTIHQVLSYHSKQEGGKYQKELEELAEWMVAPPQDCLNVEEDEHYKVPPRQVKSLLDIPNFIFNKPLSPVASAIYPAPPNTEVMGALDPTKNKLINTSQDSGISTCTSGDDFLNCSTASFVVGGGPMTGKSSDSELSDTYTPPRTPEVVKKKVIPEVVKEAASVTK